MAKTNRNSIFLGRKAYFPDWLYIMVLYINYYGFKKNQILTQNPKVLALVFTKKESLWQKLIETPYFLAVKPIFHISYT
jgi:hypothetical protein